MNIVPGAKCSLCNINPATTLTRFVAREEKTMNADAMLVGGATCWSCAEELAAVLQGYWKPKTN